MTTNHLILDFSHVYCDEKIPKNDKVHWMDCSDITECDLYCSKRAEEEIRARIAPYGIHDSFSGFWKLSLCNRHHDGVD